MTAMTTRLVTTVAVAIAAAACSIPPDDLPPADEPAGEPAAQPAAQPVETGPRWITIDADAVDTAREVLSRGVTAGPIEPREVVDGVALLEVDARDLRALSEAMHEQHGRCGGFVLHDALEDGRAALRAKARLALAAPFAPSYTLDHAAAVNALLPALEEPSLRGTIQQLSGFQTRFYTSTTGIAVSSWLRDRWAGYAGTRTDVQFALFTHPGFAQQSVIATIPGTERPDEVIVIGGHLDSIAPGSSTAPGADDDASGIATLSEVLRVLLAKDFRPKRTLRFIAYAAEEVGLRGSSGIVADVQAKQTNVIGVLQLDMTNFKGSPLDMYLISDFTNAAQNAFVGKLIDTYVGATWGTDQCGYGCSDHASWHNAGYPASMPAEARFADTNPSLHTPNDTLAMSGNNATHAMKFARLAAAFAVELAKGTVGPPNAAPAVSITAPAAGATFGTAANVMLAGTATDTEDGALSDRLAWSSSLDGSLGSGASRSVKLSAGAHVITASVADSAGAVTAATASIEITVGGDDGGAGGGCATSRGSGPGAALAALAALAAIVVPRRRRRG